MGLGSRLSMVVASHLPWVKAVSFALFYGGLSLEIVMASKIHIVAKVELVVQQKSCDWHEWNLALAFATQQFCKILWRTYVQSVNLSPVFISQSQLSRSVVHKVQVWDIYRGTR